MTIFPIDKYTSSNSSMTAFEQYSCHRNDFRMKNCSCKWLGIKRFDKFYSSPDCSIPLFSFFSFLEISLVNRTLKDCQRNLLLAYTG